MPVRPAHLANLQPQQPLAQRGNAVAVTAAAKEIVTLRVELGTANQDAQRKPARTGKRAR
jgi:hypothetical protein